MSVVSSSPCIGLQLGQGGWPPGALGPELSMDLVHMGCRLTLQSPRAPASPELCPTLPAGPLPPCSCLGLSAAAALGSCSPAGAFSQL